MRDIPIIYSGPMVRSLWDERKFMTRRPVRPVDYKPDEEQRQIAHAKDDFGDDPFGEVDED